MKRQTKKLVIVLLCLLVAFPFTGSGPAMAAASTMITVNDAGDNSPAGDGRCTLREAIQNANQGGDSSAGDCAPGGTDTAITFHSSLAGQVISLTSAGNMEVGASALVITGKVTIAGDAQSGIIVERNSGAPEMRLFYVKSGASLTLEHVTLKNGVARGATGLDGGGGAAGFGGAIFNSGNLTITASALTDNQAIGGGGGYRYWESRGGGGGGGLAGSGGAAPSSTLYNSPRPHGLGGAPNDYSNSYAGRNGDFGGGGNGGYGWATLGGGGYAGEGGAGGFGGGGGAGGGNINGCGGNGGAGGFGGGGGGAGDTTKASGYCSKRPSPGAGGFGGGPGLPTTSDLPGSGGGGAGMGGAIFQYDGTVSVTNTTVTANKVIGGDRYSYGGAMGAALFIHRGNAAIRNSTLASNNPEGDSGALYNYQGIVELTNNILALNTGTDLYNYQGVLLGSENLVQHAGGSIPGGVVSMTENPRIGALDRDSGPSDFFPLLNGSPAIDAGTAAAAPVLDVRGIRRDTQPDLGAYEYVENMYEPIVSVTGGTSVAGQTVSMKAEVWARASWLAVPGGTVQFNAGTYSCSAPVVAGVASCEIAFASPGDYEVNAAYSGDGTFTASTSPSVTHRVEKGDAVITVTEPPPATSFKGQEIKLGVKVTAKSPASGTPSGSVVVKDGSAEIATLPLADGAAVFRISGLDIGVHQLSVAYLGDNAFHGSTTDSIEHNVRSTLTTTKLTSSQPSGVYGQEVTFSAQVTAEAGAGVPTGTVTFKDGVQTLGTAPLLQGAATFKMAMSKPGTLQVTAEYSGSIDFSSSVSGLLQFAVSRANTATVVSASKEETKYGEDITLTARVTAIPPGAGEPTGTVVFRAGSSVLGSKLLDASGTAELSYSRLLVGQSDITAEYSGDGNFNGSISTAMPHAVRRSATVTTIESSAATGIYGEAVTFTASVVSSDTGGELPTGVIAFKDGSTVLGTGTISGGKSELTVTNLEVGTHSVAADYAGDLNYTGSVSDQPAVVEVQQADTTIGITASHQRSVYGEPVTITAEVQAAKPGSGSPTGMVIFKNGGDLLGTGALSGGIATLSLSDWNVGTHFITAEYEGSPQYRSSNTGVPLELEVSRASTEGELSASVTSSVYGEPVELTFKLRALSVEGGVPTGMVSFQEGDVVLGTASLTGGVATLSYRELSVGTHLLTAHYEGSSVHEPESATLSFTVNKAATEIVLTPSVNSQIIGKEVTLSAEVSVKAPGAGLPAGEVIFKANGSWLGTGTLDERGRVQISTAALDLGNHELTAEYKGNGSYLESVSQEQGIVIVRKDAQVTLNSSVTEAVYGQSVTLTVDVQFMEAGTGEIVLRNGDEVLGSQTLDSNGQAVFLLEHLELGTYRFIAYYSGDSLHKPGESSEASVLVKQAQTAVKLMTVDRAVYGDPIEATALVDIMAPGKGLPGGTIDFYSDEEWFGRIDLSSSEPAAVQFDDLPIGMHTIKAVYSGDAYFEGSTASKLVQVYDPVSALILDRYEFAMRPQDAQAVIVYAVYGDFDHREVTSQSRFESSDPAVAAVDANGVITAVGEGTAEITISFGQHVVKARVMVKLSEDASLSVLNMSEPGLSFDPDVLNYRLMVHSGVQSMRISATAGDSYAMVQINDAAPTEGMATAELPLSAETTRVIILVTAQDRQTVREYRLEITKQSIVSPGSGSGSGSGLASGPDKASVPEAGGTAAWLLPQNGAGLVQAPARAIGGDDSVVEFHSEELLKLLESSSEPQSVVVSLPEGTARLSVDVSMLSLIASDHQEHRIGLTNGQVSLELPVKWMLPESLSRWLGISVQEANQAKLRVDLNKNDDRVAPNAVSGLVEVALSVELGSRILSIPNLDGNYYKLALELKGNDDTRQVTGVAVGKDGKLRPLPSRIFTVNGKEVLLLQTSYPASFTAVTNKARFTDTASSWASGPIQSLGDRMIVSGYPDGRFRPEAQVTRAELVSILSKALGSNAEAVISANYTDVAGKAWYASDLAALERAGIVTGYGDGTFKGEKAVTREEAVVMLMRVMAYIGSGTESGNGGASALTGFADQDEIGAYARTAVSAAERLELIRGYDDQTFRPAASITRAEAASMIYRMLQHLQFID